MSYEVKNLAAPGLKEILLKVHRDARGSFVKSFHESEFTRLGIPMQFREEFYTVSRRNVLRGMHFQLPPHDQDKLVWCLDGSVIDVVVDLRVDSPTFRRAVSVELSGDRANLLWIPKGFAHGFYATSDRASMMYKVTAQYSPEHDTGVLWSSIDFRWPESTPLLSERDSKLPRLEEFDSPFRI